VLLVLHFPSLRMLWCRSPAATATYFAALKQQQEEPTVEAATAVGTGAGGEGDGGGADEAGGNAAGMELLRKLPGVHGGNVRSLLAHITCVADVARLPLRTLEAALGKANGAACHAFLHSPLPLSGNGA
jgi:DNA excision repair protein ERCC-4